MSRAIRNLILCAVACVSVVGSAYASGQVWGLDPSELAGRLERGEWSILDQVDFDEERVSDVRRLGEDASFAVGAICDQLGLGDVAVALWELGWEDAVAPWDAYCFDELAKAYDRDERYADLESLARDARARYPVWQLLPWSGWWLG